MAKKSEDAAAQDAIEGRSPRDGGGKSPSAPSGRPPTAGPHAEPSLINPDATPGTGALPPPGQHDEVDSTSS